MKKITTVVAVAATGLLMTTALSLAAKSTETARDVAMRKCNAQVIKQYPRRSDTSYMDQRTAAWKSCMVAAGQQP